MLAVIAAIAVAIPSSAEPANISVKLIVGGNYAEIEDHPYQVALLHAGLSSAFRARFCGGSLIHESWVLTAAHCVEGTGVDDVVVGAGRTRLTDIGDSDRYPIDQIYIHPAWDTTRISNDVALLQLSWPLPTSVATPISLLDDPGIPLDGTPIVQSGWGQRHDDDGGASNRLMEVTANVAGSPGHNSCGVFSDFDSTSGICTDAGLGKGVCDGDSGGPNVINIGGTHYLAGVTSYGSDAGCGIYPEVLARVSTYVEWIRSKIGTPLPETLANAPGVVPLARAQFDACPPSAVIPPVGFTDTDSTDVDCIAYYGITRGTTETTYSPDDPVTRWQMALYLTRAAGPAGVTLGAGADGGFTDISGKSVEIQTAINQIKELGITIGKTATTFVPDDNVTRQEMALFIERFLTVSMVGPGGVADWLKDDDAQRTGGVGVASALTDPSLTMVNYTDIGPVTWPGYTNFFTGMTYEGRNAVAHLWHMGITSDEGSTSLKYSTAYRPGAAMTRSEMANFMAYALDHTNARPMGLTIQASYYDDAGESRVIWAGTTQPELSVSFRDDDFTPVADVPIDVFYYNVSTDEGPVEFTAAGRCSTAPDGPLAATNAKTKCHIDSDEQSTDTSGNLVPTVPAISGGDTWNLYAWTAPQSSAYDRDIHIADTAELQLMTKDNVADTAVNYSGAILNNDAVFPFVDLSGSDFTEAELNESVFTHAILVDTDFTNAYGQATNFASAEVSGSDFTESRFISSTFDNADLYGTNFSDATITYSSFSGTTLTEANLTDASARYAVFTEAILFGADLTDADLNNAILTSANLRDATLIRAHLDNVTLNYGDLREAAFNNASVRNANLIQVNLSDSDFSGADLSGADLDRATLVGVDFSEAILVNVNLEWSNMQSVDLSGADLTGSDLTGANLTHGVADSFTRWPAGFDPEAAGVVID